MAGPFQFAEVDPHDFPHPDHGPNGQKLEPLSIRQPLDIIAMEFDESDFPLKNGYLSKGDPLAVCGAVGIGKSRLILQLLIAIIAGRDFLGWPTNGKGSRWLLLQTENVCRRLKGDLAAKFSILSSENRDR
jgi:RecA-family ATPase